MPRDRLLFVFPYVRKRSTDTGILAGFKEFLSLWNAPRSRFKQMEIERTKRYELFRQQCKEKLNINLPQTIGSALFVDFLPNGEVRLLQPRHAMWHSWLIFPNLLHYIFARHHRKLQFNVDRTVWSFMKKLYGH